LERETLELLRDLLTRSRVLSLAVVADGEPIAGLLPFAVTPDFSALIVHASRLARHSKGLRTKARFDAVLHAPDTGSGDPLQLPRVTVRGHVVEVEPTSSGFAATRGTYLAKLPTAAPVLELGGFQLFRLELEAGRLVAGFARALNLSRDTFRSLGAAG
jgi:putative heme iron utilization protein